ncbi:hypothetical protein EVA_06194 [gut metagenome]|uniref:Uncharacterized protein n=1 Tax=gut metagenome TaxID=749906 RepID=J9GSQ3_9ZZZZ
MRSQRHQIVHTVTSVDVEKPADGADAVGRVGVASMFCATFFHPKSGGVLLVFSTRKPKGISQVMDIGAFAVGDVSQQSLAVHLLCGECKPVVATVFSHEAMTSRLFRRVDEQPALFKGTCSRYFHRYMFPVLHGFYSHVAMRAPIRTDVDEIHIRSLADFLPGIGANMLVGSRSSGADESFISLVELFFVAVGDATNFRSFDISVAFQGFHAALTQSDQTNSDQGDRFTAKLQYLVHSAKVFLPKVAR